MIGIRWSNYYQHKGVEVMQFVDKDLKSIQEARILVESARDAHFLLREYDQETLSKYQLREKAINKIRHSYTKTF